MGRWCAGVLVAALVASCGDGTFDVATLDARARELQPAMEGVLGEWPGGPACVCVTSPDAMAKLLAAELTANLEAVSGVSNAFIPRMAKAQADMLSLYLLGKVEADDGTLHMLPANFRRIAKQGRSLADVASPGFRDVVLIHEMVHVYQHRRFGLARFLRGARTEEELIARSCVIEGHAQHVARAVALGAGLEDAFRRMTRLMTGVPDDVDGFLASFLEGFVAVTGFPYREGENLVDAAVAEFGYEAGVERLFTDPPRTPAEVAQPARYVPKSQASRAFDRAVRLVARMLEEEGESVVEKTLSARALADWAPGLRKARRGVHLAGHASTRALLVWCPGEAPPAGDAWALSGDIAVSVTSADAAAAARLRDGAVEFVRAGREGSPWDGLSGADARAAFLAALGDPHWGVRWRAVRNLARTGPLDAPARAALRPLLADDDRSVRLAAARALGVAAGD